MNDHTAILLAGLGFGDEGKGTTVDFLTRSRRAGLVVRYNGGAQAAHNVVAPDGRHHTFAQFASGMFVPGVKTHLSRFMLISPLSMMSEERHLRELGISDAWSRTTIDADAVVITPFHRAAGRLLEMSRGTARHGSCGMGVGRAVADVAALGGQVLFAEDLRDPKLVKTKLRFLQRHAYAEVASTIGKLPHSKAVRDEVCELTDPAAVVWYAERFSEFAALANIVSRECLGRLFEESQTAIFEGAQGMLLDPVYGFVPHVTKTDITYRNAETLLGECGFNGAVTKVGVVRSYMTRHGAGPLVTEDEKLGLALTEPHNGTGDWQGNFRAGYFDAVAIRYALSALGGIDELAVTCVDRLVEMPELKICTAYELPEPASSEHFTVSGGLATDIVPASGVSRPALTQSMKQAKPVYTAAEGGTSYISKLEELLNVSVSILSFGPAASGKLIYRTPCTACARGVFLKMAYLQGR